MRYLKTVWIVGLALLWAPITTHCRLEIIPALAAVLACCDHEETTGPHDDTDCERDGCASVESGDYRPQDPDPFLVAPDSGGLDLASVAEPSALRVEVSLGIRAPPEQRVIWQSALDRALPIRAPPFVS